jgi:tRNA (cmo5U34)-methyltransferase
VQRSVPGYERGHDLIERFSDFFVKDDSICYDLGCSTGELLRRLATRHDHRPGARWIGVDVERDMVEVARERLAGIDNVTVELSDITRHGFLPTDLVVSYYCLQFIAPKHRQTVVDKIYAALEWGGAFLWFEKVRANDARFQDMVTSLYQDFKTDQGFDAEQILTKTRSLRGVLEPFSSCANLDLLTRAGFVDVIPVFRDLCFEGLLAVK